MSRKTMRGVVHGNVIELDSDAGMADGEQVEVILRPLVPRRLAPGEGLQRTEGALADDAEWDEIMQEIQQARRRERRSQWEGS